MNKGNEINHSNEKRTSYHSEKTGETNSNKINQKILNFRLTYHKLEGYVALLSRFEEATMCAPLVEVHDGKNFKMGRSSRWKNHTMEEDSMEEEVHDGRIMRSM